MRACVGRWGGGGGGGRGVLVVGGAGAGLREATGGFVQLDYAKALAHAPQRFKPVNRNLFAAVLLDCGTCGLYSYCNPPDYGLPKRPWSAKRECFCLYVHHAPCTVTASRLRQCRHVQFALQHSSSQHSVPL